MIRGVTRDKRLKDKWIDKRRYGKKGSVEPERDDKRSDKRKKIKR